MRKRATIVITADPDILEEIYDKTNTDATEINIVANMLRVRIYQDTKGYQILMDTILRKSLRYTFAEGREYTKDEYKKAKYFHCEVMYPWEHDPKNAEEYGTEYTRINACPRCGFGKEQTSDLIINTKKMKKYQFAQIIPEFLITENVRQIIEDNNLSGCDFKPVKDFKGRTEPILYQLIINNILPRMDKDVKFEIWEAAYCPECDTNGKFLRSEIVYKSQDLTEAQDFNLTYEYIGQANYLGRHLIVSAKVRDIFNKNKIKPIAYEPVRIKDNQ
ncbi:MAG: hypothetical protein K0S04_4378 [Herbinix sp.]|jgi:hypothetical protein|nr:hypothetical protein [Herbinix sp.]